MTWEERPPWLAEAPYTLLYNLASSQGKVAWAENGRYGIAFYREIDPQAVRAPVALATFLSDSLKLRARPAGA